MDEDSADAALAEIADIEHEIQGMADAYVRREPLGFDRHWNRYWLLGAADGEALPVLFVELKTPVKGAEVNPPPPPQSNVHLSVPCAQSAALTERV